MKFRFMIQLHEIYKRSLVMMVSISCKTDEVDSKDEVCKTDDEIKVYFC